MMEQLQQQILELTPAERLRLIAFIASSLSEEDMMSHAKQMEARKASLKAGLREMQAIRSGRAPKTSLSSFLDES
jgi:hypothetical protein